MNRRDFLKAAGATMASAALPKLPKIETQKPVTEKDVFSICKFTEAERRAVYDHCSCGEHLLHFKDGNWRCRGCGNSDLSGRETKHLEVFDNWLSSVDEPSNYCFSPYKKGGEPIFRAIMLSQWERFRAHHMVHGTFDDDIQFSYKVFKRIFSDA